MDIEIFCKNPSLKLWNNLNTKTKLFFIQSANFCIKNNTGNTKLASQILNLLNKPSQNTPTDWEYITLPKNTILYRATKTPPNELNRATYYTNNIQTANTYLPSNKKGYLNIYRTKKEIRLFKLNSLFNVNKLLRQTFPDKRLVIPPKKIPKAKEPLPGKTVYDIVRSMFTGVSWVIAPKEDKPLQLTRVKRNSVMQDDLIFSNWLCENNFNGYEADVIKQNIGHDFPAETMICKPQTDLEIIKSVQLSRQKPTSTLLAKLI